MAAGLVKGEGFAVDASVMEANASRYHGKAPDEIAWAKPERRTRAVKEYLAALEAEAEVNPDRKPPKVISPSDPCSAWTAKANKRVQFGYGLNYLIDIENTVIVDVEATPARTYDEVAATRLAMRCRLSVDLRGCSGTLHTPHLSLAANDDRRLTHRYRVYGGDFLDDVAYSARAPIVDEDGLAWRDHDTLHVRKRKERADVDVDVPPPVIAALTSSPCAPARQACRLARGRRR